MLSRRLLLLALVLALSAGAALAAALPAGGTWSGTVSTGVNHVHLAKLPISFKVQGSKVADLTVGPATFGCEPWNESGVTPVQVKLPKLTGFPAEKLFAGPEYNRSFVRRGSKWKTTTNPIVPQGPEYVAVAGNFIQNKFGDPAEDVIVSFGADPDGKIDPAGSLGCGGIYWGVFATHK